MKILHKTVLGDHYEGNDANIVFSTIEWKGNSFIYTNLARTRWGRGGPLPEPSMVVPNQGRMIPRVRGRRWPVARRILAALASRRRLEEGGGGLRRVGIGESERLPLSPSPFS
jgi:hypothetical protein